MKNSIILFLIVAIFSFLFTSACSTTTTETSYELAKKKQTVLTYSALGKNNNEVKNAIIYGLTMRKWIILKSDYPITAELNHRGQSAKVSITHIDDKIIIETKGSNIEGEAYVPIRFVDFLIKTIYKRLA